MLQRISLRFVPEIYFDLIARIVPAALALTPYLWPVRLQPLSLFSGLIFLCFSYFLGYIADEASRVVVKPLLGSISRVISRTTRAPLKYRRSRELLSLLSQSTLRVRAGSSEIDCPSKPILRP